MQIPSDYIEGYEKAKAEKPELASAYIAHTLIGDPEADVVTEELNSFTREDSARYISLAMEGGEALRSVPPALRAFIERMETTPDWFDPAAALPGCRLFYRHPDMFTSALAGAGLIEGFTTGISKSFMYTGRLLQGNQGIRRLKQNNRHQMEIFLPGGLERQGEGWKLTLRIRLVHAQIRRLLSGKEDWDTDAWGVPISAAHLALANSVFSARLLHHVQRLSGKRFNDEERKGFMLIWRYVGTLMGMPEVLIAHTEEEALTLFKIGLLCEPPPGMESIAMANTLINSVPSIVDINPKEAKKLLKRVYSVSRALIGDDLADQLHFPKVNTLITIPLFIIEHRLKYIIRKLFYPSLSYGFNFDFMLKVSHFEEEGISYKLPDSAHAELSKEW